MSAIELHEGQSKIYYDLFVKNTIRHSVAVCSRGFGKSFVAAVSGITAVVELINLPSHVPNKNVFIVAPTYAQVTDIYFPLILYQLGMTHRVVKVVKDEGRLVFPNNVELRLLSYESIDRIRGLGAYFIVNDEVRDWTSGGGFKEAWESVLLPCIATRWSPAQAKAVGAVSPGRSLTISTPKGYDYLYDLSNRKEIDPEYGTYIFDHTKSPRLDPAEIETIRKTTDPIKFAREYGASFKDSGNAVFYCFDRNKHVVTVDSFEIGTLEKQGETVHVGIDFNVMLNCSSAFAVREGKVYFLEEFTGSADTETLAISIKAKFWPNYNKPDHPEYKKKVCKIYVYPDPSGKARKTSAVVGRTDFSILQSHGFEVLARNAHPSIIDSVACVNRLLLTAAGTTSMYVRSGLNGIIKSLERTKWVDNNSDTATIDKKAGDEHFSDGIRYAIEYLFPIRSGASTTSRGFGF